MDIQAMLQRAYDYGITYIDKGVVANYIPELAKEDKTRVGGAIVDTDGSVYTVGSDQYQFSIQSIVMILTISKSLLELSLLQSLLIVSLL